MLATATEVKPKCQASKLDGEPCNSYSVIGGDYCYEHEPSLAESRRESKAKGGRKRAYVAGMKVSITAVDDILDGISEVIGNLKTMDCTVSQSRALVDAYLAALKVFELKELDDRVAEIEELMKEVSGEQY